MSVTETHEEKETLVIDVLLPGHEARTTTSLFKHSKEKLVEREGGRCFICGRTAEETGPLESHHHPIERSLTNLVDWPRFSADCKAGMWGPHAQVFDWDSFLSADPFDPYKFVDDQTVNGLLLCADHHRGKNEGVHYTVYPFFIIQRYAKEGTQFTPSEVIHHEV
jgi:hypothetical protein